MATGTEDVDQALRGDFNTVTHEFAHLVHFYLETDVAKRKLTGRDSDARFLRSLPARIDALYREAEAGKGGQAFIEHYAATNDKEYFAQSIMAYLNPCDSGECSNRAPTARQLYLRNPKFFVLAKQLVEVMGDYPAAIPTPTPPAVKDETRPSPLGLLQLATSAAAPAVAQQATKLLSQLETVHQLVPSAKNKTVATPQALDERAKMILSQAAGLL